MPYLPKEHEAYDLLPFCREHGGEVFDYPDFLRDVSELLDPGEEIFPYGFHSYEEYFSALDAIIAAHAAQPELAEKLRELRAEMQRMNRKEDWSVVRYVGPSFDPGLSLTSGRCYYWPTSRENPVYCGVVDDEEFTSYLYATDAALWEIVLDPTGMAHRTIFGGEKDSPSLLQ